MPDYTAVVTNEGQAKIALAIAGGATITISHIAVGDGLGAPITPLETMTAMVNEVWRAPPTLVTRDATRPQQMIVEGNIPVEAGPFTIREAALFTSDGKLFAICNYPATDKPSAAQGAVTDITLQMVVVVDTAASVQVTFGGSDTVHLGQLLRPPFIAVDGIVNSPPGAPALGATVLIGTSPSGAFVSQANKLAQWTGSLWAIVSPPARTVIGDQSTGEYHQRLGTGLWALWDANHLFKGLVRLATLEETQARINDTAAVTPASLGDVPRVIPNNSVIWVRSDGNDANDGSANTAAKALATLQGAIDMVMSKFVLAGRSITIRLGLAGTYAPFSVIPTPGTLVIEGNTADQNSYIIAGNGNSGLSGVCGVTGATVLLRGVKLANGGNLTNTLASVQGGHIDLSNVTFYTGGAFTFAHMVSLSASSIHISGPITIDGAAGVAFDAQGGAISAQNTTITFASNPGITDIARSTNGQINFFSPNTTFSGSVQAACRKYEISLNGVINTFGGGAGYFPGGVAGVTSTGGQYN